jgi:hypothetical protein
VALEKDRINTIWNTNAVICQSSVVWTPYPVRGDAVAGDQNVKLEVNGRDLSGWENTILCSSYLEVNGRATASK